MKRGADPRPDRELGLLLAGATRSDAPSEAQLRALSDRILAGAAPLLEQREQRARTIWDYAERWSGTLIPLGVGAALAAGVCLFWLSNGRDAAVTTMPAERVALLGAATNRVSSHDLLDLLTADSPAPHHRRR